MYLVISNIELSNIELIFRYNLNLVKMILINLKEIQEFYNIDLNELILNQKHIEGFFFCNVILNNEKILSTKNKKSIKLNNTILKDCKFKDVNSFYKDIIVVNKSIYSFRESSDYIKLKLTIDYLENLLIEKQLCLNLAYDRNFLIFSNKFFFKLLNI